MRALFDINVLIAMLDPDHDFYDRVNLWWQQNSKSGWASCPITENAAVRIISNPAYSRRVRYSPAEVLEILGEFVGETDHEFWADDPSVRDEAVFDRTFLVSGQRLTDIYLVALVAKRGGTLVTLDEGISIGAVRTAKPENLLVI